MKFTKSSSALVEAFGAVFPDRGEKRQMFGYPCGFVNGNMFAGLFAEELFVRISDDEQKALAALGGKPFAPMANRPMKGYLCVPAAMHDDRAALKRWLEKALAHTASLPPKVKKAGGPAIKQVTAKPTIKLVTKKSAAKKH
jgi:TfoX/Sxy family transcriptional regulator of competence genes